MRLLSLAFILTLAPAMVFAQRGGGHGGGGGGGGFHGGGSMGGGSSRGFSGGAVGGGGAFRGGTGGNFRGGTVGGFRGGYGGFRGGYGYGGRFGFGFGFGYPYWGYGWGYPYYGYGYGYGPGYYDGYDPYDYGYGYPSGGYYDNSYYGGSGYAPAYDSGAPSAVINQNFGAPAPPPGGGQGDPNYRRVDYYLIAFMDHSIQAATAYHVQGDQLYYTTRDNVEHHVALSSVDRRFSEQLNRDRRVQFQLPQ